MCCVYPRYTSSMSCTIFFILFKFSFWHFTDWKCSWVTYHSRGGVGQSSKFSSQVWNVTYRFQKCGTLVMSRGSPCSVPPLRVNPQGALPRSSTSTSPSSGALSTSSPLLHTSIRAAASWEVGGGVGGKLSLPSTIAMSPSPRPSGWTRLPGGCDETNMSVQFGVTRLSFLKIFTWRVGICATSSLLVHLCLIVEMSP